MILKEHELLQIDEKFISQLREQDPDALAGLSIKLVTDLKEVLERLNQNPSNSSRPSGSLAPWDKGEVSEDDELNIDEKEALQSKTNTDKEKPSDTGDTKDDGPASEKPKGTNESRKPGRQPDSQGFGRIQKLANTDTKHHHCECCSACNTDISSIEKAYTGFQTVNVEFGNTDSPGLSLIVILHLYYQGLCSKCGLENRTEPLRASADTLDWKNVGMTEWRLIGPDLAALIVYLSMDMRVTRRKVKQFLEDVLGLELSIGTIQNCIVESARALSPVEKQLLDDLCNESLIHADETSHNEAGARLWLWVFVSSRTALFLIGHRTDEIFVNVFDALIGFTGHLMTDGYGVYRTFLLRLRCWAHLLRKARGLSECYTSASQRLGKQVETIMNDLVAAVYQAREGPDGGAVSILSRHQEALENLRKVCVAMSDSSHKKTRELGREFLNDWDAIFRVLEYPAWPLTNNEAERALRNWVILRKITQGTRSDQGSRALALFASVFVTCRLRNSSPLLYIRDVINMRRQGSDVPKLPQVLAVGAA
jgi:hypothetical protein